MAADCEINDDLLEDELAVRDEWLKPGDFSLVDFATAEFYYRELMRNSTVIQVAVKCGSGCTGHTDDFEEGDSEVDGLDSVDREVLRRTVAAAVREYQKNNGSGSVPEGLQRWAAQTLEPKVNWRRALAAAVRRGVHLRAGSADYTWRRPSRRDDPSDPVIRPGMTRPVPDVAVVVDTSASMDDQDLGQALAEIRAILNKVVPGDAVRVFSVDAAVSEVKQVFNVRQVSLTGGGGTDMRVGITAAAESKPAVIIVISDGYTPWPETPPPGVPLTIAALTSNEAIDGVPSWIRAIDISD